jgi:chromosome segregation ATPase
MKRTCLLVALLAATHAGAAYKCVDEKGFTHVGDTPPAGCAAVVMYEINRAGQVIRRIDPTLTPEQVRQKEIADAKRLEAEKAAAEQKRKDMALLQTFSSEKEFDVVRDRSIQPLQGRIRNAQERTVAIDKRLKEVDEEMEFYKAGKKAVKGRTNDPPRPLVDEQERLKAEKATLQKGIAASEKEIEQTRAKFDTDKRRWVALKSSDRAAKPDAVPVADKPARK